MLVGYWSYSPVFCVCHLQPSRLISRLLLNRKPIIGHSLFSDWLAILNREPPVAAFAVDVYVQFSTDLNPYGWLVWLQPRWMSPLPDACGNTAEDSQTHNSQLIPYIQVPAGTAVN